jgi:hypothetical protein
LDRRESFAIFFGGWVSFLDSHGPKSALKLSEIIMEINDLGMGFAISLVPARKEELVTSGELRMMQAHFFSRKGTQPANELSFPFSPKPNWNYLKLSWKSTT